MPLHSTYLDGNNCSMARTLEIVGERWTLLVVRDAFYGVRRFGDFASQLGIPRVILSARLRVLVEEGILDRLDVDGVEYRLTSKGTALWPTMHAMMTWGDEFYSPAGPRRTFHHERDGGLLEPGGHCMVCGELVAAPDVQVERGPGFDQAASVGRDPVSQAIVPPLRLLEPIAGR
jgi:DNA-binding HxlR family transcriptional regulator